MPIKFKYNLTQSLKNVKRTPLLIVGLAMILAMLSVMNIYVHNVKLYKINNLKYNYFDIGVYHSTGGSPNLLVNQEIFGNNSGINADVISDFPIESSHPIFYMANDFIRLSSIDDKIDPSKYLDFFFSDEGFYNTPDFDRDFEMIEGKKPQNSSEYIIDIVSAEKIGFFSNDTRDLTLKIYNKQNSSQILRNLNFNQQNGQIVGIFAPKQSMIRFFNYSLQFYYDFNSVDSITSATYQIWNRAVILGVIDQNAVASNPYINLLNSTYSSLPMNSTYPWKQSNGFGYQYDRGTINPNRIEKELQNFQEKWSSFYYSHISDTVRLTTDMHQTFRELINSSEMLYTYQILNVPLLMCAIIVGNLLVKTSFTSRLSSYHESLIKGYPRKMINIQLIWEIFIIGIVVGLGSILFSWIFYKPIQVGLNPLLFARSSGGNSEGNFEFVRLYPPTSYLEFTLNFGLILGSIGMSTLVVALIYLKMIVQFQKVKIYEISESVKTLGLNAQLNENLLLSQQKKKKKKRKKEKTPPQPSFNDAKYTPNETSITEKSKFLRESKLELYKSLDYEFKKNIKRFGLPLFFIGWIPVILIYSIQWGYYSKMDNIAFFAQTLNSYNNILVVLAFFSPFLIIYGLMRWLVFEKPLLYANICEKFTKIFLGEKGLLNALETLRYHNLKVISILLAIISGTFIFTNISLNSNMVRNPVIDNAILGGDFNIQAQNDWSYMRDGNQTITYEELITIENILSNRSYYSEDIQDVWATSIISQSDLSAGNRYEYDTLVLSNFTKFEVLAQSSSLQSSMPDLSSKIRKTMDYNVNSNEDLGVLVTEEFLDYNQYKIGDVFTLNPKLFPFTESFANQSTLSIKIIDTIGLIPGITYSYGGNIEILADIAFFINPEDKISHDTLNFMGVIEKNLSSHFELSELKSICPMQEISAIYSYSLEIKTATDIDDGTTRIFSPHGGVITEFYPVYIELTLLTFFLVLSIIILILLYRKENQRYHGLLLIQGFGKKNISILIITQMIFVIFSSYIIGTTIGLLTGYAWTASLLKVATYSGIRDVSNLNLPIIFNVREFLVVLGILLLGTISMLGFLVLGDQKKDYASYLSRDD
ncbi:hypothetical protein [Candidatus Lokiarchaeum ossiferum]